MGEHGAVLGAVRSLDESWPLAAAAAEYARRGVPVFPCESMGKRPVTGNGFHAASTDLHQVRSWWQVTPGANIGIPTGLLSGVVVVDVDVHGPVNGYKALRRADEAGFIGGWELLVRTPTGGMHAYYSSLPSDGSGGEQRSWQVAGAGIDFRGDGGYIIAPPSRRVIDNQLMPYVVQSVNPNAVRILDSQGLRDFLDPRPQPDTQTPRVATGAAMDLDRLAAWVARRPEGERNHGLFWAACTMAENDVAPGDALTVLTDAAGQAGLGPREVSTTVRSAYRTVHGSTSTHNVPRGPAQSRLHPPFQSSSPASERPGPTFQGLA